MSYECGAQLVGRILGSSRFNDICKSVKTIAVRGSLIKVPNKTKTIVSGVKTRAVESESREVGKSLKIGKNRIKLEKSDLISYPTFWQKCQNAIKCQNACTSGQGPASEYLNI